MFSRRWHQRDVQAGSEGESGRDGGDAGVVDWRGVAHPHYVLCGWLVGPHCLQLPRLDAPALLDDCLLTRRPSLAVSPSVAYSDGERFSILPPQVFCPTKPSRTGDTRV